MRSFPAPQGAVGGCSSLNWRKTWGPAGKPISEISLNLIKSQEVRDNHFNLHKSTMVGQGKPLAKVSVSPYRNKDLEQAA